MTTNSFSSPSSVLSSLLPTTQPVPSDVTVLKSLTAVRLDVTIWTARKKLTPADFGASDLPPEKLASLGRKKVCNPDDLRIFATLKARAVALLERHGVRFLGGWAIPDGLATAVAQNLQIIRLEFEKARDAFMDSYDQAVHQWIADNPGWENLIAGSVVDAATVRSRLTFGWQMFRVVPTKSRSKENIESLATEVGTLSATLFEEIGKAATETWRKSFAGKRVVTHKALSPVRAMMEKLSGLSCVEARVAPVVTLIRTALSWIPSRQMVDGENLAMLQGLVKLMTQPQALIRQGQEILDGASYQTVLKNLAKTSTETPDDGSAPFPTPDTPDDDGTTGLDSLGLW